MGDSPNPLAVLVKSALAATPAGAAVLTALGEYIPSARERATRRAVDSLGARIENLDERVEAEYVKSEDFADLFKNWYYVTERTQHEEKLRAAGNVLANALLKEGDEEKLPARELDHFMRCVDSLSIGALQALGAAYQRAENVRARKGLDVENVQIDFGTIRSRMGGMDHDLLMGLVSELTGSHLLHSLGPPGVKTERYGNYPFETTPLGYRFTKYILEPGADSTAGGTEAK